MFSTMRGVMTSVLTVISVCCILQVCSPPSRRTLQAATVSTPHNPSSTPASNSQILGLSIGGFISIVLLCGGFVLSVIGLFFTILFVYCKIPTPIGKDEYVYYKDVPELKINITYHKNVLDIVYCWYFKNKNDSENNENWEPIHNGVRTNFCPPDDDQTDDETTKQSDDDQNDETTELLPKKNQYDSDSWGCLAIKQVTKSDVGTYKCILKHKWFSFLQREINIKLINLKVYKLTAVPSFTSVLLKWKKIEGIWSYQIKKVQGEKEYTYKHDKSNPSYKVLHLDPNKECTITVIPYKDGKDYSEYGTSIDTKTKDMTLKIEKEESFTSVLLKWEPLNDEILKYKVTVDGKTYPVVGGMFEVPNLQQGHLYPVSVTPDCPGKDYKHHSSHITCKTKAVTMKGRYRSAVISWDPIEGVKEYRIYKGDQILDTVSEGHNLKEEKHCFEVRDLEPGTKPTLAIEAIWPHERPYTAQQMIEQKVDIEAKDPVKETVYMGK